MTDQPKPKLYKRPWFLLITGAIAGVILLILVIALPQYLRRANSLSLLRHTDISNSPDAPLRAQIFGSLPESVQDCAKKVIGWADLPKLFTQELAILPDEQAQLSMCIYNTLSADNKKCAADLAGGEQNLELFFRNLPNKAINSTAKCMGISQYSFLLVVSPVKLDQQPVVVPSKPVASGQTSTSSPGSYTVQDGDTLFSIAQKFNKPWTDVAALNKLKIPFHLTAGQTIRLP
jgi:LysM repeat protein